MVRRHTVALSVVLAGAIPLAGCSSLPEAFDTTPDDVSGAARVWVDPWIAPDEATAPGPGYGSDGWVDREVARRTTAYRRPVESAAAAELRAAAAAGWVPTSSSCDGDEVRVALVGPDAALVSLVVTPDGSGSEVVLSAVTPHHLDEDWAAPPPATGTCLDGGGGEDYTEPPGGSEPLRESDVPDSDGAAWEDDSLPDASKLLLAEVNTDPALSALGVRVAEPTLDEGDNRRRAPSAETTVEASDLRGLADLLPGWQLTHAACGADGPVRATFLGDFEAGPAVVRAVTEPDGTTLRVTLPVPEGPEPAWLQDVSELTDTACWRRTPSRLVVDGTPAVLPDVLTPIAD